MMAQLWSDLGVDHDEFCISSMGAVMIGRHFFAWAQNVSSGERAEGVRSLVQDYLYMELSEDERTEVESILTAMLEDHSPLVRRAMAETFAREAGAPHHIMTSLASDQPEIAAIVLGRSPLFSDDELIDFAALAAPATLLAMAERPDLRSPVAATLAGIGSLETLVALASNHAAEIPEASLLLMLQRFGQDGALREAILVRHDLSPRLRIELAAAAARSLASFTTMAGWLSTERGERIMRESCDRVAVVVAGDGSDRATLQLARHLRLTGSLTASLLLRALLSADRSLFEASLCELSGLPFTKVVGLTAQSRSQGFHALYQRAGLPGWLLPAFQAALAAQQDLALSCDEQRGARLMRPLVSRVMRVCETMKGEEGGKLLALLRRFQAEAARDDVRDFATDHATAAPRLASPILLDLPPLRRTLLAA